MISIWKSKKRLTIEEKAVKFDRNIKKLDDKLRELNDIWVAVLDEHPYEHLKKEWKTVHDEIQNKLEEMRTKYVKLDEER
jgi:predicted transcriptional regulator